MHNESITPVAPSERTHQIIALAREALAGVDAVRARIRRSTDEALECGRLLIEERAHVQKTHGHGAWLPYFEAHFASVVSYRHAMHWLKQAKSAIASIATNTESNQLRNQVLTLGLFPPKQHTATAIGNGSTVTTAPIVLPKHSTHLGLINRFSAWKSWFLAETKGEVSNDQRNQLLKDFEPIEQFIEWLRQRDE